MPFSAADGGDVLYHSTMRMLHHNKIGTADCAEIDLDCKKDGAIE